MGFLFSTPSVTPPAPPAPPPAAAPATLANPGIASTVAMQRSKAAAAAALMGQGAPGQSTPEAKPALLGAQ